MNDEQKVFLTSVDAALRAITGTVAGQVAAIDDGLQPFADLCLSAATAGGKRLRPRFAYWAWRCVAGDDAPLDRVVSLGAALELLHAAILVHDDIIDASELRRGQPSVRAALATHHRQRGWAGADSAFGDHTALLVGDLLWGSAHDLFDTAVEHLAPELRRDAVDDFRAMRLEVISGQLLELRAQAAGDLDPSAAEKILQYKTSSYTVERPVKLGLDVGGLQRNTAAVLARFARATGHAFQLRDDLADLFGSPASNGKSGGDDIRAGKPTELLGAALRLADETDRAALRDIVGRSDAAEAEMATVRGIFLDCGAVTVVADRIETLVRTAVEALDELTVVDGVDASSVHAGLAELLTECTELSFLPSHSH